MTSNRVGLPHHISEIRGILSRIESVSSYEFWEVVDKITEEDFSKEELSIIRELILSHSSRVVGPKGLVPRQSWGEDHWLYGGLKAFCREDDMVYVPPGEYFIGPSPAESRGLGPSQRTNNVYNARVHTGYWIGRTPVTQGQWESTWSWYRDFCDSIGVEDTHAPTSNPAHNVSGPPEHRISRPMESVSWYDCVKFCNVRSLMMGKQPVYCIEEESGIVGIDYFIQTENLSVIVGADGYRLPREVEWESALKAGGVDRVYGPIDDISWLLSSSSGTTKPVGLKSPNAWGLCDMIGNVWEWCFDEWYRNPTTTKQALGGLDVYNGYIPQLDNVVLCGEPRVSREMLELFRVYKVDPSLTRWSEVSEEESPAMKGLTPSAFNLPGHLVLKGGEETVPFRASEDLLWYTQKAIYSEKLGLASLASGTTTCGGDMAPESYQHASAHTYQQRSGEQYTDSDFAGYDVVDLPFSSGSAAQLAHRPKHAHLCMLRQPQFCTSTVKNPESLYPQGEYVQCMDRFGYYLYKGYVVLRMKQMVTSCDYHIGAAKIQSMYPGLFGSGAYMTKGQSWGYCGVRLVCL